MQGEGCRVQGAGCRAQGAGFRVHGAGFTVHGPQPRRCWPCCDARTTIETLRFNGVGVGVGGRERERRERGESEKPGYEPWVRHALPYTGLYSWGEIKSPSALLAMQRRTVESPNSVREQ